MQAAQIARFGDFALILEPCPYVGGIFDLLNEGITECESVDLVCHDEPPDMPVC